MIRQFFIALAMVSAFAISAFSQEVRVGDLIIETAVLRATPPAAKVAAGFVTVRNVGESADRLTGASTEFADRTELHEMKMMDGVMKMRPLEDGLEIPAGQSIRLMPGGNHIMFMKLNTAVKAGDRFEVKLKFETAGTVKVTFDGKSLADTMKLRMKHVTN